MQRIRTGTLAPALLALLALLMASTAAAQWTFTEATGTRYLPAPGGPNLATGNQDEMDMISGDFDRDGDQDVAIVRKLPFSNPGPRQHVLLMNVNGVLQDLTSSLCPDFLTHHSDGRDVQAADLDGDGWADLIVVNTFDQEPEVYMNLRNDAGGNWLGFQRDMTRLPVFTQGSVGPMFCEAATGDIDGDNDLDIYFVDYDNTLEDKLVVNDGTGHFTDESTTRLTASMRLSAFGTSCQMKDINGDGSLDIIKLSTLGSPVALRVLYNDGSGNFTQMQDMPTSSPYMFRVADFDRDGDNDFYVVQDPQDRYVLNDGTNPDGTINVTAVTLSTSPGTTGFGGNVNLADLDQDGYLDVLVSDVDIDIPGCGRRLSMLRNQGRGSWQLLFDPYATQQAWNPNGSYDSIAVDVDGDGRRDVVSGTCGGLHVFMNDRKLSLEILGNNDGSFHHLIRHAPPNTRVYTIFSFAPVSPGTGPMLGLGIDALLNWINLSGFPPVDVIVDANGSWGLDLPPGALPIGLTIQARALAAANFALSPVVTTTF